MEELGLKGETVDLDGLTDSQREKLLSAFEKAQSTWSEPELIQVTVCYDKTLREITERKKEILVMEEGVPFPLFLKIVFDLYPAIQQQYSPGTLGFTLNNKPPGEFTPLEDGDIVHFSVPGSI